MSRAMLVGAVLSATVLLSGCGLGMQDLPVGRSADGASYDVQLQLSTAAGLVLGAEVRVGQKVIGRVAAMRTDVVGATVTLSLSEAVPVPRDVHASLELPTALGNPYIRLTAPDTAQSATPLRDGDVISQADTEIGPQIESTLAALGLLVNGSGLDQMQVIVTELDTAFGGRSGEVRGLTATMGELFGQASAHQSEFDDALVLAARVSEQLVGQQEVIDGFLDSVPAALAVLDRQRATITALLDSSNKLAANANAILASSPHGLGEMLIDASATISALGAFNDRIGATLGSMNVFVDNFLRSARGDYLMFDGALDIPGVLRSLWLGAAPPATPSPQPLLGLENLLQGGGG